VALLVLGVLLFASVHLVPSLAPGVKAVARERIGEGGYKGLFSLLLLGSFALMITGWRNTDPVPIYQVPAVVHKLAILLVVAAFWLMAASATRSRIRSIIRHPQLTWVALWGIAHLLLNGDSRALVLFGGLTAWSLLEMPAISRREGVWIKGEPPGWGAELTTLLIAALTVGIVIYIHPWLSGVPVWW